ncbi:unnamed protein product [Peronospora belbahrii]|uniref:Uncharacterized protein n=1 Tax=Peronospora belbahrii TaxID=622444 RepID=A0ABN8D0R7_9STRA|nr:unnamed protein product [Peronospora belbahrii]
MRKTRRKIISRALSKGTRVASSSIDDTRFIDNFALDMPLDALEIAMSYSRRGSLINWQHCRRVAQGRFRAKMCLEVKPSTPTAAAILTMVEINSRSPSLLAFTPLGC